MDKNLMLNIIGYLGSALVLLSFLMASVLKLRIINIAGSLASVIYSLMIGAYPTVVMNGALILINIYYIIKMLRQKNIYHVVETGAADSHLKYFLDYYHDDILKHFPEFGFDAEYDIVKFLYCENTPASVFIGRKSSADSLEVLLDYASPTYRDCTAGKYIYETLAREGYKKAVLCSDTEGHEKYLKKVGFVKSGAAYEKML